MAQSMGPRWLVSNALWSFGDSSASHRSARDFCSSRWWFQHRGKKGGLGIGYSGHKHQKGEKELAIVDNHGFVVGPIAVTPVNQQDTVILPETLTALVDFTDQIGIALEGSAITLAAGFDSQANKDLIKAHQMKPVIYPNRRNTKTAIAMARLFRWFDHKLYRLRYKVERTFGWQDTFRKLVISYARLPEIRKGCRLLA
jgi:Transposase DDE domain